MTQEIFYRHTQRASLILWVVLCVAAILVVLALASEFRPEVLLVTLPALAILVVVGWLFSSLTVTVSRDVVAWSFGPGLLKWSLPVADIEAVESTRTSPLVGWGIRWTPSGMVYNVSGFDAVRIRTRTGRTLRIGTDEPEELRHALENARSTR